MTARSGAPAAHEQLSSLNFAVLLLDDDNYVVEANYAAEEMFGRSARKLCEGRLWDLIAIADKRVTESLASSDARIIARGVTIATPIGEMQVNISSSPIQSHAGWRLMTLSPTGQPDNSDDTERVELRAPAVLAHEIKNPLSAIKGASQLLARRVAGKDKPLTKMIISEVDRIAELVDRMQQLGAKPIEITGPCNLHEAIRNAMGTVRAARTEPCELVEEFDPSLPAVAADQGALEQVLINLISNACDASALTKAGTVSVRTRFVSGLVFNTIRLGKATRLPIEISVIDRGPGVDPELRDHVFEPFVSGKPHGQGLGLALVRKLLRDMGGRIIYERDEHAGETHFRINLPVAGK